MRNLRDRSFVLRLRHIAWLAILACTLGPPCANVRADVAITEVQVDGQPMPVDGISQDSGSAGNPLRISSLMKSLEFRFAGNPKPGMALRYQLEGRDEKWRDLPSGARVVMRFGGGNCVGSEEFPLEGQTPGWRGTVKNSDYIAMEHQAVVPEKAHLMVVSFLTAGMDSDLATIGIDAVQVLVEHAGDPQPKVFDFGIENNGNLIRSRQPGQPAKWVREGGSPDYADIAQLKTLANPTRHIILALLDNEPHRFGGWSIRPESAVPVAPGDRVTLRWRGAYCIGNSGPGTASYQQLLPGNYCFRAAAFTTSRERAGTEASLQIVVVAPFYAHGDFWLAVAAVVACGTAWTGWRVAKWRDQVKIDRIERERVLERERERIAGHLHDDLGAGLTRVAMLSELARKGANQPTDPSSSNLNEIFEATQAMTRSIDEIVWAINPSNDRSEKFLDYLVQVAEEMLRPAEITLRLDLSEDSPAIGLESTVRHHTFLAVKESLHNIVKHAGASEVHLRIRVSPIELLVQVQDNGRGFLMEDSTGLAAAPDSGHDGLRNMRSHLEAIGGAFRCRTAPGQGTELTFQVPLAQARHG